MTGRSGKAIRRGTDEAAADGPGAATRTGPVNPFVQWLLADGAHLLDARALIAGLAERMLAEGIALGRLRVTIRTLHPQVIGITYTWWRGKDEVEAFEPPHSILQTDTYLKSPYAAIFEGAGGMRRRLDVPGVVLDFPVLQEVHDAGMTDYLALPLEFSDGRINAVTFCSDRRGGFTGPELRAIHDTMPAFARLMEVHALRRTARTLLDTYLGPHTGRRVLDGQIRRGDGEDIHAVIWFSDLRDSTALADSLAPREFLKLLNAYFDGVAGAVLAAGGEVLRFIGDAVLAIFPIIAETEAEATDRRPCTEYEACRKALAAARDACARLAAANAARTEAGAAAIRFGIGLHVGHVLYGNIGVPQRLEFTVVGAAANEAARLESLTKSLDCPVVVSASVARYFPGELASLGRHALRGVARPTEVFTLPELTPGG